MRKDGFPLLRRVCFSLGIGFGFGLGFHICPGLTVPVSLPLCLGALLVTLTAYVTQPWLAGVDRRVSPSLFHFALLLAFSTALGGLLTVTGALWPGTDALIPFLVGVAGLAVFFTWVVAICYHGLSSHRSRLGQPTGAVQKQVFRFGFAALMLCWLPIYLAYYPGIYAYDVTSQAQQCATGLYDTRNPLWHTLFLKLCFLLGEAVGSPTFGVGMGTLAQMALAAAGLAYAVSLVYTLGVPSGWCWGVLGYFALFPVFPILSISFIKDALFGVTFLISLLHLYRMLLAPPGSAPMPWERFLFGLFVTLSLVIRYNAILAYGFGFAGCLLACRRFRNRRFIGTVVLSVAVALLVTGALGVLLAAQSRTGKFELFSLPAQQLRRAQQVATNPEDSEAIASCFLSSVPAEKGYVPTFGDIARFSLNTTVYDWNDPAVDIPVNPEHILKVWLQMAARYPFAYAEAFLQTNRGSWYLLDTSHAEVYGKPGNGVGYLVTAINDTSRWYAVHRQSLFPRLASALSVLLCDNAYQRIPVLSLWMGTGFQAWLFFLCMLVFALRKQRLLWCVCLLPLGLWASIMLGPCTLVRYLYPLYLANPLLLALAALPQTPGRIEP